MKADDRFVELKQLVEGMKEDFQKFYEKGNFAAGTRLRKKLSDLKRKAQEIRSEVQAIRQAAKEEKAKKSESGSA